MQGQFVLTRRKFGNQGFSLDPRSLGPGIDVIEEGQHAVQLVHRIDIGFGVRPTVQHVAGRNHLAFGAAFILQKKELQLERACRVKPLSRQSIDLPLQGVARVG
jgi:hypothetical protein